MTTKEFHIDDIVSFWVFMNVTGNYVDNALTFGRVIRIGEKKIKVKTEYGGTCWLYKDKFGLDIEHDPELIAEVLENTK